MCSHVNRPSNAQFMFIGSHPRAGQARLLGSRDEPDNPGTQAECLADQARKHGAAAPRDLVPQAVSCGHQRDRAADQASARAPPWAAHIADLRARVPPLPLRRRRARHRAAGAPAQDQGQAGAALPREKRATPKDLHQGPHQVHETHGQEHRHDGVRERALHRVRVLRVAQVASGTHMRLGGRVEVGSGRATCRRRSSTCCSACRRRTAAATG